MKRWIAYRKSALGLGLTLAILMPAVPAIPLSCNLGPHLVLFPSNQAFLDAKARTVLDEAINAVGNCGYAPTQLAGHTDTSEPPELGLKRVNAVKAYLVGHGIPAEDIAVQNFGSTRLRVPTPAGTSELQNRRVEVTYGPLQESQ